MNNLRWIVKQDGTKILQFEVKSGNGSSWFDLMPLPEVKEEVKVREWTCLVVKDHYRGKPVEALLDTTTLDTTPSRLKDAILVVEKIPNSVQVSREQLAKAWDEAVVPKWGTSDASKHNYGPFLKLCRTLGLGEA